MTPTMRETYGGCTGLWNMTSNALPLLRLLLALACLATVAGCSMIRVGYGQAETFAAWKADEYFELDVEQKQVFRQRFARFYAWHRHEELPTYALLLTQVRDRFQQGLQSADVAWILGELGRRYENLVRRGADSAAEILVTLTPAQIENLRRQWERDNRRFAREHRVNGTLDERKRARSRRMLNQITDWTGRLSPDQEARIVALIDELPHVEHHRLQDRLRRQQEFVRLLDVRSDRREYASRLQQWMLQWNAGRSPEYRRVASQHHERRVALYMAVERMLTPEQRAHVVRRMQGYIDDMRTLSGTRTVQAEQPCVTNC